MLFFKILAFLFIYCESILSLAGIKYVNKINTINRFHDDDM